jgi:hypothetical protein
MNRHAKLILFGQTLRLLKGQHYSYEISIASNETLEELGREFPRDIAGIQKLYRDVSVLSQRISKGRLADYLARRRQRDRSFEPISSALNCLSISMFNHYFSSDGRFTRSHSVRSF